MKNVLLLEPNTVLAQSYTAALTHSGYCVAVADGAQSGIDQADQQTPDLVILELQLVAHSGIEFLHEFRSYPDWQHIPVIVNTLIPPARFADVEQILTKELGVRAVLYKPRTSLHQLLRRVREQLAVTA